MGASVVTTAHPVRADVAWLGTAIENGADTSPVLRALDSSIAQLPLLRPVAGDIRRVLETA